MSQPVFISYASPDGATALKIRGRLEGEGIACWMAPRDIRSGDLYGRAIIAGLRECRVLVLLLSAHANQSTYVPKEVERAVSRRKTVCVFRLQEVMPSDALEFFVSDSQWVDGWGSPLDGHGKDDPREDEHIERLAAAVKTILAGPAQPDLPPEVDMHPQPPEIESYARVVGLRVVDSTGTTTSLSEYGIVYNAYAKPNLANAVTDELIIERGAAIQKMPWRWIERADLPALECATFTLRDGTTLGPLKLRSGSLVGRDEVGLDFTLALKDVRTVSVLRDASLPEIEALIRDIPALAAKSAAGAPWTCGFELTPKGDQIDVALSVLLQRKVQSREAFSMPGPHKFWAADSFVGIDVGRHINLGPFSSEGAAQTLALALHRLNTLLLAKSGAAGAP